MSPSLRSIVPTICLVAVLAMAPVAPEAGNTLFLAAAAFGLALMWPDAKAEVRRPLVWMPLAGVLLIALAYGVSSGMAGLAGVLYFAPLLAIWPLVTLLRTAEASSYAVLIGMLALCGASGAGIMAVFEVQATGTARAGGLVANPIHFADVALMVGFIALIGAIFTRSIWRWLFLAAPVMSMIAVMLSGTRGAMVAFLAMTLVAVVTIAAVRLVRRRIALAGMVGLAAFAALGVSLGGDQISGIQRVLTDVVDTFANGVPGDASTGIRLQMYLGGFRAFLEAPLFGHGPVAFTAIADQLADVPFGGAPHLHNDLVDMAASAGLLGLAAYFLIILAPLVEAIRAPTSASKPWTIVLVVTLVSGFFVMGLTNAMFGILTVTVTFAAICAITGFLTAVPATEDRRGGPRNF